MGLNYPKNQGTEWINMKQQIKNAFTSANSRVPYQKIAAGILKVSTSLEILSGAFLKFFYSNGTDGIYMGSHIDFGGENNEGFYVRRNTGTVMLSALSKTSDGSGFTALWDSSGSIVVSDDSQGGRGVARPWIPIGFGPTAELTTPPANRQVSGTSDTAIYSTIAPMQHPKLEFWGYVYIQTAGATAELKVKDVTTGGTVLYASTQADGWLQGTMSLPSNWTFGSNHQLDITIRRASGSGNVGFTLASFVGRQT